MYDSYSNFQLKIDLIKKGFPITVRKTYKILSYNYIWSLAIFHKKLVVPSGGVTASPHVWNSANIW